MKTIKISGLNWTVPGWRDNKEYYIGIYLLNILNKYSNKYNYEYIDNPYEEECDLIFYSLWGDLSNLQKCKGNPIFIYWTHEYLAAGSDKKIWDLLWDKQNKPFYEYADDIFKTYKLSNYSLSFNDSDETNLYYPYWVTEYDGTINLYNRSIENNYRDINIKKNFCVFCASHENYHDGKIRSNLAKELNNYKTVSCCGKGLHNTGDFYLPFNEVEAQDYCKDHKFYISFENAKSFGNTKYVTEKLLFGWKYSCIPLYWGDNRGLEYFNKEAFIDLNNLNQKEMIQKIIDLDNDNDQCQYILNQYLFKDKNINYKDLFNINLTKFIENIL